MKRTWILLAVLFLNGARLVSDAHPSSGLVVTDKGEVYFVHSGVGVARIDPDGKLTYVKRSAGGHWLCMDREGAFARTQPKFFERITPEGDPRSFLLMAAHPLPWAGTGNFISAVTGNVATSIRRAR